MLFLSVSKTEVGALDVQRSWSCVCDGSRLEVLGVVVRVAARRGAPRSSLPRLETFPQMPQWSLYILFARAVVRRLRRVMVSASLQVILVVVQV